MNAVNDNIDCLEQICFNINVCMYIGASELMLCTLNKQAQNTKERKKIK